MMGAGLGDGRMMVNKGIRMPGYSMAVVGVCNITTLLLHELKL